MENYKIFVQKCVEIETPSLDKVLTARQQFIDECDDNVLRDQLLEALGPFIDQVKDEDVAWWGLIMCGLFEIHIATQQLEVCACEKQ